jgi:hypothetical protein
MSRWTLEELTTTSLDKFRKTNVPNAEVQKNLKERLSPMLEFLYATVGPFTFESVYRSDELNAAVGGSPNSLHRVGLAADLRPTMGANAYAATLAKYPELRSKVGEIIVNSSSVVHVSAPQTNRLYPIQRAIAGKGYVPFTKEELRQFIKDYGREIAVSTGIFAVLGLGYLFLRGAKT